MLNTNSTDPYKNKKMTYITGEMKAYVPGESDIFLPLKSGRKARFMCGEPLVLTEDEVKLWEGFL